jgi:3-carboxy-cis,cis-muconate cycloisomerase
MVEDHERSTGPSEIEWIVLPQMATMTHSTLMHTQALIEGLEVHPESMRKNLELTRGAIVSEAVMMGLGPMIGRQIAHDLVYDVRRELVQEKDRHCSLYIASHPLLSSSTTTTPLMVSVL